MVRWQGDIGRIARDHTAQPNGWAHTVFWGVLAQHQQFRQFALKAWNNRLPLAVFVGPQDARGRDLNLGIEDRRVAQRFHQMLDHAHG